MKDFYKSVAEGKSISTLSPASGTIQKTKPFTGIGTLLNTIGSRKT
jgi:hypothetical protein